MARVVQRRTGPTYLILTVAFVFLFVIAAVFAVVFYQESQKYKKTATTLEEFLEPVLGDSTVNKTSKQDSSVEFSYKSGDAPVQRYAREWLANYSDRKGKNQPTSSMIADLLRDRKVLLDKVFPAENMTVEGALKAMEAFYHNDTRKSAFKLGGKDDAAAQSRQSLVNETIDAYNMAIAAWEQNKKLDVELASWKTKYEEEKANIPKLQADITAKAAEWQQKLKEALDLADKNQKDYSKKLEEVKAEHKQAREGLDKKIAELDSDNTIVRRENLKLLKALEAEKQKYADLKRQMIPDQEPQIGFNGKVLRVPDGTNICYIDIGSDEKVKPGMTFSVYAGRVPRKADLVAKDKSADQLDKEWDEYLKIKCKAKLVVIDTDRRFSECRIVEQRRGDPILAGDVITNPIVDPIKSFNFVVKGDFDLYGTGRAARSSDERKRKIDQIKKYIVACGGKIADDIDANTDYVVLGEAPETLGAVLPEDDERVKAIKELALKELEEFNKTRDAAFKSGFQILNANRFLTLTGYIPAKPD
ncbi:MAG: hypothetical protein HZA50_01215 [Planctomycetes bacterium]|nr:hypothetical protein [Planctomycetota bacterium]